MKVEFTPFEAPFDFAHADGDKCPVCNEEAVEFSSVTMSEDHIQECMNPRCKAAFRVTWSGDIL